MQTSATIYMLLIYVCSPPFSFSFLKSSHFLTSSLTSSFIIVFTLLVVDHVWTKVETSNPPSRMMSSAVMHYKVHIYYFLFSFTSFYYIFDCFYISDLLDLQKMYIFGGLGDNSTALNDLYQYDFGMSVSVFFYYFYTIFFTLIYFIISSFISAIIYSCHLPSYSE